MNIESQSAAIRLDGVTKVFRQCGGGLINVFDNFRLEIEKNSFVAILGPSGCGKSTLLRMIAGLLAADAGSISLGGDKLVLQSRVGLMLQQYTSLPWLTVRQNVEIGSEAAGRSDSSTAPPRGATYYLSRVGLFGWQNAYPRELSGGMLQRLALARTLAMEPEVFLLDEPLGALDALTRAELQQLIRELYRAEPRTFVMVTHDVDEALAMADRILVLGSFGRGILYDSASSSAQLHRQGLIDLLRGERITFAGGTWQGYAPLLKTGADEPQRPYELWLGMTDQERLEAIRTGRADGAFFTIQAIAQLLDELTELHAVIAHPFCRQKSGASAEHVMVRRRAEQTTALRWVVPGRGLEALVVRKLDPNAFAEGRIRTYQDRATCVLAVSSGDADAFIVDQAFAESVQPGWRKFCRFAKLPPFVWSDFWSVLVVPQSVLRAKHALINNAVRALAEKARTVPRAQRGTVHYFTLGEAAELMKNGDLSRLLERWGAAPVGIDAITAKEAILVSG